MKFKPTLVPTIFTVVAFIVLVCLGTWQIQRLNWKNNIIAQMNIGASLPAIRLSDIEGDFNNAKYRKVKVFGEFLHEDEVHLFTGQKKHRGKYGYNVLTPMQIGDGGVVLIDRGWVPADKKERDMRPETIIKGFVEIEGMLHEGESQKRFVPDNDLKNNIWFWIDTPTISAYTGNDLKNMYIRSLKKEGDNPLPVAGDAVIKQRNDHLQYAVTWYGLAIILVVIYILYHTKRSN